MRAEEALANRVEGAGADVAVNDADGGEGEAQQATALDAVSCQRLGRSCETPEDTTISFS